jgi:hypothetical protein
LQIIINPHGINAFQRPSAGRRTLTNLYNARPGHRDRGKSTLNSDATCLKLVDTLRS